MKYKSEIEKLSLTEARRHREIQIGGRNVAGNLSFRTETFPHGGTEPRRDTDRKSEERHRYWNVAAFVKMRMPSCISWFVSLPALDTLGESHATFRFGHVASELLGSRNPFIDH